MADFPTKGAMPYGAKLKAYIDGLIAVPAWAGARTRSWEPSMRAYNTESPNLRDLREIIRAGRAGADRFLLCVGDSKTAGAGLGGLAAAEFSYPAQLRDLLGGVEQFVFADPQDNQWTLTSGFTATGNTAQHFVNCPSGGGSLTFTSRPGLAFTGFAIAAYKPSGTLNLSVVVDGGAPTSVALTNTPGQFHYLTPVGSLANTGHTITITSPGEAFITGIGLIFASGGLRVTNAGRNSSDALDWSAQNWSTLWASTFGGTIQSPPHGAIVNLGTNDNGPTTPQDHIDLIGDIDALGIPTLIVVPGGTSGIYDHPGVVDALYDAADTYDLPLIDFRSVVGDYAKANATGLMADVVHENGRGYALEAQAVARLLAPAG